MQEYSAAGLPRKYRELWSGPQTTSNQNFVGSPGSSEAGDDAWKPTFEWLPSQKGFRDEAPHRQSAIGHRSMG